MISLFLVIFRLLHHLAAGEVFCKKKYEVVEERNNSIDSKFFKD